jgi:DNA-binding CsgD family transcriptional regulator
LREFRPMFSHDPAECGNQLSGADALTVLEIIHRSLSCSSESDYKNLFSKIQTLFPFDFAFTMLGHHDKRLGLVEEGGVNISFPEEWIREYTSKNFIQVDSIVIENFCTYEVQNWSVARKALYRKKEITSLGMDFGMRECYTHGSKPALPGKTGSMFCFAGPAMERDTRIKTILDLIVPHLHLTLSRISDKKQVETINVHLSGREKEVLDWLKEGKSSWDMSVILGISERTVNFHVDNIKQKLGATNRPQALALATRLGLIDLG